MNNSTEGVTLFAAFINDILKIYKDRKDEYKELFDMADGHDLSDPFNKVPMSLYNDMCQWLEDNLGKFNLIKAGRNVGESAYNGMLQNNLLPDNPKPIDVMEALVKVASQMIQDPENRGWEIVSSKDKSIIMRRTQTFNGKLQIGVLDGLLMKTGVMRLKVDMTKSVDKGAEFDEYEISWL